MPVQKFAPMTKEFSTFDCDAHITELARKTNPGERLHCTLRQGVVCLARAALAFSKQLTTHLGPIRDFLCHYNRARAAALPG